MNPEDRAWEVVRRAYEERVSTTRRRPSAGNRPLLGAVAIVAVLVAAVLSPPGHAVFERVRQAVGVEHAAPALLALPSPGQLLVLSSAHGGTWIVDADGARRRIGAWEYASWSPHARYVVAADSGEIAALDLKGNVRWTLARRRVAWPVWEGTEVDTRIAYMAASGLRVVAGDGTDDRLVDAHAVREPPAWAPRRLHTLAYESRGSVVLEQVDSRHILWRARVQGNGQLVWSGDGRRLAIVASHRIVVLSGRGKVLHTIESSSGVLADAAFRPGTHRLAVVVGHESATGRRSEVKTIDVDRPVGERLLFAGPGVFGDIAWSPNGQWLLVDWPTANQWVFLHGEQVRAVANVDQQFPRPDRLGPTFDLSGRWCCQ